MDEENRRLKEDRIKQLDSKISNVKKRNEISYNIGIYSYVLSFVALLGVIYPIGPEIIAFVFKIILESLLSFGTVAFAYNLIDSLIVGKVQIKNINEEIEKLKNEIKNQEETGKMFILEKKAELTNEINLDDKENITELNMGLVKKTRFRIAKNKKNKNVTAAGKKPTKVVNQVSIEGTFNI